MYKITCNYHTHTYRCGHAHGEDELYVICAIEAGIKVLGFSDHTPWPGISQPRIRMGEEMLENYVKSLTFLKEQYKDKIEIHIGLEAEYMDELVPFYESLKKEKGIEYFILGQHGEFNDVDGPYFYNKFQNDKEKAGRYVRQVLKGMESGLFAMVAHPDHFLNGYRIDDEFAENQIRQICQKSKELNIPLELNLTFPRFAIAKGEAHDGNECYPFDKFWKVAGELQAPVVFGIDAHNPFDLLVDYDEFINSFVAKHHLNVIDFSL